MCNSTTSNIDIDLSTFQTQRQRRVRTGSSAPAVSAVIHVTHVRHVPSAAAMSEWQKKVLCRY